MEKLRSHFVLEIVFGFFVYGTIDLGGRGWSILSLK